MTHIPTLLRCLLTASLALAALPSRAQINPKWMTKQSPDFLNLYQQSNTQTIKPEIVTVMDFSGSMNALMYHSAYVNGDLSDSNPSQNGSHITFSRSGSGYATYTVTGKIGSYSGPLVRPDGTLLTAQLINDNYQWQGLSGEPGSAYTKNTSKSSSWPSYYVQNWVRSASHVRITRSGRTVDIPIPWTALDSFTVQPDTAKRDTRKMYNTYPLKMTIQDPVGSSHEEVEIDSCYRHGGTMITGDIPYNPWNSDGALSCTLYTDPGKYTRTYANPYFAWIFTAASGIPEATSAPAFANGLPARTRIQAVKEAFLRTWVKYYDKVFWATRGLQSNPGSKGQQENWQDTNLFSDSRRDQWASTKDPTDLNNVISGSVQRQWMLMNADSLLGMRITSHLFASGGTPLTYAMGNALAQFNDPNSVFNDVEIQTTNADGTIRDDTPQECSKHFLLVFTDGQPSEGADGGGESMVTPYLDEGTFIGRANQAAGTGLGGNDVIKAHKNYMNPNDGEKYWNIMNLAAVAAHGGEAMTIPNYPAAGAWPTSGFLSAENWLPFWIKKRGAVTFSMPHPITTMTVGVSLAGDVTSASGGKPRMFRAAVFGDPLRKEWDLEKLKPFALVNPSDPTSKVDPNSVYFFDAADPKTLVSYLDKAFKIATEAGASNAASAPVLPTLGAGLGTQVYLGQFTPPEGGGPVWPGDLLMFPTRQVNGQTQFVDANGNEVSGALSKDTAAWSAAKILQARGWKNRVIYTRLPATSAIPEPPLVKVLMTATDPKTDPGFQAIQGLLPGSDATAKFSAWSQFVGADGTGATRSDIMGDVINSTPASLAYDGIPDSVKSLSGTLASAWGDGKGKQFNMVFVGDNQGFLHAFGEVTWTTQVTDASKAKVNVTAGVADELWAFVPTDLLPHIDYYRTSGNPHRYAVDGSPTIYLRDIPQGTKQVIGDGKYSLGATNEAALVIFGLGKGGRSYYAIDVRNPGVPRFTENSGQGWSLCPDEVANFPANRFLNDSDKISAIAHMGYSTTIPTPARMLWGTSPTLVQDFIFLGGGYSVPEIEADYPTAGANTKLGRSVVALEVLTGKLARVWDLSKTGCGPIPGGVIPYEFVRGSGLHFRAYFTDFFGGLWALGSGGVSTADATKGLRTDSAKLESWSATARCLFKQAPNNGLISTWPVPFSLPSPIPARTEDPKISPAAVGIAWVTGDRMNPLDKFYGSAAPTQHRLNVFFDRQDSNLLGLDTTGADDTKMQNCTSLTNPDASVLNPAHDDYYLKKGYGYYLNFPSAPSPFVSKGIIPPQLLSGTLFFSAFVPKSADPCAGGTGNTYSYRLCDVMRPVFSTGDAKDATAVGGCKSGRALVWTGVASRFAARNSATVIQVGIKPDASPDGGTASTAGDLKAVTINGNPSNLYLKPRVWRTVR